MQDKALETIAHVIGGMVDAMTHGHLPALDFQDIRTVFGRNEDGTAQVWYVGVGQASGESRDAATTALAFADLRRQLELDEQAADFRGR